MTTAPNGNGVAGLRRTFDAVLRVLLALLVPAMLLMWRVVQRQHDEHDRDVDRLLDQITQVRLRNDDKRLELERALREEYDRRLIQLREEVADEHSDLRRRIEGMGGGE